MYKQQRQHNILLFILLFIVNVFYSCSDSGTSIVKKPHVTMQYNYNPLNPGKVGSYWKYLTYYNSAIWFRDTNWVYHGFDAFNIDYNTYAWQVIDSTRREIIEEIEVNIGDTTFITKAFENIRLHNQQTSENPKWLYWNGDCGIYALGGYSAADTLFEKGIKIKYPVEAGEIWHGQDVIYNGADFFTRPSIYTKCISVNEKINTPIGTFECYVFVDRKIVAEDVSGFYDYYKYYSPEVGLICQVVLNIQPNEQLTKGFVSVLMLYDYLILN